MASINAKLGGSNAPLGDVYAPSLNALRLPRTQMAHLLAGQQAKHQWARSSRSPIAIRNTFDSAGRFSGEPVVSGTLAQYDGVARSTHTVNINNLSPSTTYYYLVVAFDTAKNVSITTPASFRTKWCLRTQSSKYTKPAPSTR